MTEEREKKIRDAVRQTQSNLTVVLENIYDPLNISAVIRSCDAVGIRELFVIYTQKYLDKRGLVLGKRTSGGAFKWTDVYLFEDIETCFERVRSRYGRILATLPSEGSHSLFDLDLAQPTALLFGNEDDGISPEAIALCDGFFTIPQAGLSESLNISVACAVTLYEAYRQRKVAGHYDEQPLLDEAQQNELFERWKIMLQTKSIRNRGMLIEKDSAPLLPIYAIREHEAPPRKRRPLPKTNFNL